MTITPPTYSPQEGDFCLYTKVLGVKLSIRTKYYVNITMVISKMAAKMATVTLKLAYLLNYLLQISREGVYHWLFWRHIYLYQIKVHILMMSSRNSSWLPVYKHWYIFYPIQSWGKYEKVILNLNSHRLPKAYYAIHI